ncbi:hypothetical protein FEM48_Zijuj12G0109100 [Ziziphus jujuba var. spinosa]|uniref:Transcription elongation factor 1 homolog n=1 Tax=Ziziphus jujuba var. spinosa TaxID=714518 RepID=A0A978UCW8_ZIZJJ|nr:hypothetical protein FEM48_Zijuj12G0109100 [Ziziphus jujuba var. spinosa]
MRLNKFIGMLINWTDSAEQWGKGSQGQSLLQRSEWISLILFSAVPFATMEPVSNAACYDMKNLIGEAVCRICQESFSTTITALTEAIDIYSEWIDECERVNTLEDDGA